MRRRILVGLVAVAAAVTLTACSPKGQECKQKGDKLYTSSYGVFVCRKGPFGNLRWEQA